MGSLLKRLRHHSHAQYLELLFPLPHSPVRILQIPLIHRIAKKITSRSYRPVDHKVQYADQREPTPQSIQKYRR